MAGKGREANYELLRVLAMVMVVAMHFLERSDSLLALDEPFGGVRLTGSLLEAFCLVAVNVYVLIAGYFGVRGRFRVSKAAGLLCQIWFYGGADAGRRLHRGFKTWNLRADTVSFSHRNGALLVCHLLFYALSSDACVKYGGEKYAEKTAAGYAGMPFYPVLRD